jgi:hypothetical protein
MRTLCEIEFLTEFKNNNLQYSKMIWYWSAMDTHPSSLFLWFWTLLTNSIYLGLIISNAWIRPKPVFYLWLLCSLYLLIHPSFSFYWIYWTSWHSSNASGLYMVGVWIKLWPLHWIFWLRLLCFYFVLPDEFQVLCDYLCILSHSPYPIILLSNLMHITKLTQLY